MSKVLFVTTAIAGGVAASLGAAQAGGIGRAESSYAILWEKGNYVELSYGRVSPDVSGGLTVAPLVTLPSGDMTNDYNQVSLGFKYALNDQWDLAVVMDRPIGADLTYPDGGAYPLRGSSAKITSNAITALARYHFADGWSVHGGVKVQRTKGAVDLNITLPGAPPTFVAGAYSMRTSSETDVGYIIGAAYERPDIALRVALTYQSAITHDFDAKEFGALFGAGVVLDTQFSTEVPQSVTLDVQSGIAENTLLFGSIRWRDWSSFDISPTGYAATITGSLVDYPKDVVTYTLGIGRKFNENWSAAVSLGYEDQNGYVTGNLGPHDGMKSITLGASYSQDNIKITGGVTYVKVGDATTSIGAEFRDNDAVGFGIKVGYSF